MAAAPGDVLWRINAIRSQGQSCGSEEFLPTSAVAWNEQLFSAAWTHSMDMAARNYFSHSTPEGLDAPRRIEAAGYRWKAAAENIAAGDATLDRVMTRWLRSDGHCRNIMDPVFTEVAVACVRSPVSTYGTYWTMVLGRR